MRIPAVRFADDQAMVSHTVRGLQIILDALQNTSEKYNMRINTKKTNVIGISQVEGRQYSMQWFCCLALDDYRPSSRYYCYCYCYVHLILCTVRSLRVTDNKQSLILSYLILSYL